MSNESEAGESEHDADDSDAGDVEESTPDADAAVDETAGAAGADADETGDGEAGAEDEGEDEEETEGLQYGDFVRVAYTARTVEDGTLVDTTDPEVAEEEGVGEDQEFGPRTIVLGEGHIFGPVEEDMVGKEAGDEGAVTVPSGEAFGEFDQDQVRTISADRIAEDDRYPGAHVTIDGEHGHVETIIGGRARVDFNHPLAGEDVEYEYEILERVEDREAKAQALVDTFLDMDLEMWFETDVEEEERPVEPDDEGDEEDAAGDDDESDADTDQEDTEESEPEYETVEVEKETLYIEATPGLTMNQQWMMGKQQIAQQMVEQLGVDRVIVQETLGEGMGMGGLGGMMGGMGGGDLEEALDDEDIDAEEIVEELDDLDE